jgi:hypothetical protein
VQEKEEEDHLDQSCEKWKSITYSQGQKHYPMYNKRKEGRNEGMLTGLIRSCVGTAF